MSQPTLEERVSSLERAVAGLVSVASATDRRENWRSTIGMFKGDPVIREIQEEGQRLRETERREAQRDAQS